jgi:CPA2 family monovalent cation:H+ antiporter-2
MNPYKFEIIIILTFGFALSSLFGYLSNRLKLSPIVGYLFAGYLIGPYSPGFTADLHIAEQLSEIGVILMMFGVGLHFKLEDLITVKNIAIPGALVQTSISALVGAFLVYTLGWSIYSGIILGLAVGVASTMVLARVLSDHKLLNTTEGHIAVGWLVVEDILTVFVLLLVPILSAAAKGEALSYYELMSSIALSIAKFILLFVVMFTIGQKIIIYVLTRFLETKSHELFTLSILAITFLIAVGAYFVFGISIALGAFIAGMVMGKTDVKHQVSKNAKPIKDTFVVLFFLSTGMLFNPNVLIEQYTLLIGVLAIILLVKPLVAYFFIVCLKYPAKTAVIVAFSLAQIGEFSFILAEEASRQNILPDAGYDAIVACGLITIALNPLIFKMALDKVRSQNLVKKGK